MNCLAKGPFLACLCAGMAVSGFARGQDAAKPEIDVKPIGTIVETTGAVTLEHTSAVLLVANLPSSGPGTAKPKDLVYQGDLVLTGADSKAAIAFVDGTTFNISSNARMQLDEFIYDPKGKSNSTVINLAKGSFTFLAGMVAKTGNMKVETPVATMGIRGTAPRVEILEDGSVRFSTLIEEHKGAKDSVKSQRPGVSPQRRAQSITPKPSVVPDIPPEKKLQLRICSSC